MYIQSIDSKRTERIIACMRLPPDLPIEWSEEKNQEVIRLRGVSFEEVLEKIEADQIIDVFPHPNKITYPHQTILVVKIGGYVYAVPFVIDGKRIFLKTIYRSRKLNEIYLSD